MKRTLLILGLCFGLLISVSHSKDEDGKIAITTSSEKAIKSYLQGRDLSDKLRGTDARSYFQNAVAEDPNFAVGFLNLALTEPTANGFFEQLNKAVALVDKASEGEKLWILGVEAGTNGDPKKQNELYQKLVKLYPGDERAYNLLGGNYFGQQDYANAIAQYEKAVQMAPDYSQPYNQLGYSHRFMGNFKEAEMAFKKYIDLIPNDPNPYDSYAELLMKMGKYDESITNYQKALAIDPNFVASHIGIAVNQIYKDNQQAAREQLQKLNNVARNDGERRAALFTAAVSYADEGKMDLA
ncbi:MAG TPA: tetratricopeptide repeat protein, partial [bacterium]